MAPTVGRIVWYWPHFSDPLPRTSGPRPAIICHVHTDVLVNLAVFNSNGEGFGRTSVPLLAEKPHDNGFWCQWPEREGVLGEVGEEIAGKFRQALDR